jgi:serine/threonine protein kinase
VGFLQLLDSNESEKWIVTEYCSNGTLDRHLLRYKGNALLSILALIPLVRTVAQLHEASIVHRDIKPQNIFIGNSGELLLGDFGIVFFANLPERMSFTNESVGPRDFMPPWIFVAGDQPGPITPAFDVYMLGKVLWCMVSGRLKLHREDFRRPRLDVTVPFPDDPRMHAINRILEKCVVADEQDCLASAQELLLRLQAAASMMQRGGQLLIPTVPRPCRVCGIGEYVPEQHLEGQPNPTTALSLNRIIQGKAILRAVSRWKHSRVPIAATFSSSRLAKCEYAVSCLPKSDHATSCTASQATEPTNTPRTARPLPARSLKLP